MGRIKQTVQLIIRKPWIYGLVLLIIVATFSGFYIYQNNQAQTALNTAKQDDKNGQYTKAQRVLRSINKTLVRPSIVTQVQNELKHSQQLQDSQQAIDMVKQLLSENKPQAAQKILDQLKSSGTTSQTQQSQITNLKPTMPSPSPAPKPPAPSGSGGTSSGGTTGTGGGGTGTGTGGTGGAGGGGGPSTAPMTSVGVVSATGNTSPATSSSCNITGTVTFSANGSGDVNVVWSQYSTKTVSQTDNAVKYTFSAAGSQSDTVSFSRSQGLEPGDNYRLQATISSVSNPADSVTTSPVIISGCAAPPSLATEQYPVYMTTITPGTPTIYQAQDSIFTYECSVQVSTPYTVNSSGTVEAIVQVTSGSSIGYTYYNTSGATGFSGTGTATDQAYFRLPHLPSGGPYSIKVKLVEVSYPNTTYAYTSTLSSACS